MLPETEHESLQNGRLSVTLKHSLDKKRKKASGERMSFALGDGSFLLLEEIENGEKENNHKLVNHRRPGTAQFSSESAQGPKLTVA